MVKVSSSSPSLVVARGGTAGVRFTLQEGENLIGRGDEDSKLSPEVDLSEHDPEAKISRRHAIVEVRNDKIFLTDIGSLNGTYIQDGTRLKVNEKIALKIGDEFVVGKTFLRVEQTH